MRIIAGAAKGRRLEGPPDDRTRPLTDRVREALFSALGARVAGATVLDLYAGTGSIGLEGLSRGAASVTFVEVDPRVAKVLTRNLDAVGLGGTVRIGRVERMLGGLNGTYDLVFIDPPYSASDTQVSEVLAAAAQCLRPGGTILVHRRSDSEIDFDLGVLSLRSIRRYGDARIWWFESDEEDL